MHNLRVASWVLFGAKWGLSPGNRTSDSSERLLRRGSQGRSIYKTLMKGEFHAIKCLLYEKFFASHEELMSTRRDSVVFLEEMQGLGSWNQFLKITKDQVHQSPWSTECLLPTWTPSEGVEGQQLQQRRIQSLEWVAIPTPKDLPDSGIEPVSPAL